MTGRRTGKFRCIACGRITVQPIDEDHPSHEIRSWCCGCSFERALVNRQDDPLATEQVCVTEKS